MSASFCDQNRVAQKFYTHYAPKVCDPEGVLTVVFIDPLMRWFFEHVSCGATDASYSVPGATLSDTLTRSFTFMKPSIVGFCRIGSNPSH
jgi:hypothetical protein